MTEDTKNPVSTLFPKFNKLLPTMQPAESSANFNAVIKQIKAPSGQPGGRIAGGASGSR